MAPLPVTGSSACGEAEPAPRHVTPAPDYERLVGAGRARRHLCRASRAPRVAPAIGAAVRRSVEPVFSSRQLRAHQAYGYARSVDGRLRELTYRVEPIGSCGAARLRAGQRRRFGGRARAWRGSRARDRGPLRHRDRAPPARTATRRHPRRRQSRAPVARRGARPGRRGGLASPSPSPSCSAATSTSTATCSPATPSKCSSRILRDGAVPATATSSRRGSPTAAGAHRLPLPAGAGASPPITTPRAPLKHFLASPLKFEPRVTSGFSYRRLHPVLGIRRPHLGADFGAPPARRSSRSPTAPSSPRGTRGRRQHRDPAPRGRLREPLPAPVGLRAGAAPARASAGPGHRPGRRHRARHRAHLHYELLRNGTHVNPVAEQKNAIRRGPHPRIRSAPPSTPRGRASLAVRLGGDRLVGVCVRRRWMVSGCQQLLRAVALQGGRSFSGRASAPLARGAGARLALPFSRTPRPCRARHHAPPLANPVAQAAGEQREAGRLQCGVWQRVGLAHQDRLRRLSSSRWGGG